MSVNAQKRLLIVMRSTGDQITDTSKIISARAISEVMQNRFPSRSYNFGTLVVYMERLRGRFMVAVIHRNGELRYRLTDTGFKEASKLWDERKTLGFVESAHYSVVGATTGVIANTAGEFILSAV